jgi:hypothetical protein
MYEERAESKDIRDIINEIQESLEHLAERMNDADRKLKNSSEDDEVWAKTLDEVRRTLSGHLVMLQISYAVLSTGRKTLYDCQMPNQPGHSHYNVYTCTVNSEHKFCRSHDLINCPLDSCGGSLI